MQKGELMNETLAFRNNRLLSMKIQYDNVADAMYIYLKKGKVSKTAKMAGRLLVDLARGRLLA